MLSEFDGASSSTCLCAAVFTKIQDPLQMIGTVTLLGPCPNMTSRCAQHLAPVRSRTRARCSVWGPTSTVSWAWGTMSRSSRPSALGSRCHLRNHTPSTPICGPKTCLSIEWLALRPAQHNCGQVASHPSSTASLPGCVKANAPGCARSGSGCGGSSQLGALGCRATAQRMPPGVREVLPSVLRSVYTRTILSGCWTTLHLLEAMGHQLDGPGMSRYTCTIKISIKIYI